MMCFFGEGEWWLFAWFGKIPGGMELSCSHFSFNSPVGCYLKCRGLGVEEFMNVYKSGS